MVTFKLFLKRPKMGFSLTSSFFFGAIVYGLRLLLLRSTNKAVGEERPDHRALFGVPNRSNENKLVVASRVI